MTTEETAKGASELLEILKQRDVARAILDEISKQFERANARVIHLEAETVGLHETLLTERSRTRDMLETMAKDFDYLARNTIVAEVREASKAKAEVLRVAAGRLA